MKKNMNHYICDGGCKGVANEPGTCQSETCPKHGLPLQECDCNDDNHYGKFHSRSEK